MLVEGVEYRTGLQNLLIPGKSRYLHHPHVVAADIVHGHLLHSLPFSYTTLGALSAMKPVVWTLYDMWPLTGHCSYPDMYGCERWRMGCGQCPALGDWPAIGRDTTRFLWKRKARAYGATSMQLVCPSAWLAERAQQSELLGHCDITTIPVGLDTDVFRPTRKASAREVLQLPIDARVVLFVSLGLESPRKGFSYLVQALQEIREGWMGAENLILLCVGEGDERVSASFPVRTLGRIDNDVLLASCYSAADVFVGPSVAEVLGQVFLESIACGTPCVAFDAGGVGEPVRHLDTGYLAKNRDASDLARGIRYVLEDAKRREVMSVRCREHAVKEYSIDVVVEKYLAVYRQALQNHAASAPG